MNGQTIFTRLIPLLCITAFLLTGCQPVMPVAALNAPVQAAATAPKTARQAAEATTFGDLDPATACVTQPWIFGNVYETLTRYNVPGAEPFILPGLAEEWTVSDDGMTWTFHLRHGVKFHDGSEFNAEAVKFTIERNQQLNQCSAYIYSPVASIETPDPSTVVFHLSAPAPMDAILASVYNAWITSSSVQDKDAAWFAAGNDAGTGPYRMTQYEPGKRIVLERFEEYWRGWEPGQFDQIVFEFIDADMSTAAEMLRDGQLDFATSRALTPEQLLSLDAEENLTLLAAQGYAPWYIYLDHSRAPTDNLLVRQALAYSLPYDEVIAQTNLGKGTRSHGIVPVTVWGHDPEPLPFHYDLEKARALLAEAGYADGFEFTMSFDPEERPMAELWQAELAKLNITLDFAESDFFTRWQTAISGSPTAPVANTIFWGPDVIGPYTYLAPYNMQAMPDWDLSRYDNADYNALIDEANVLAVTDREAATEKFITAQRMLRDDVAAIFILDKPTLEVIASDLTGYVPNPAYGYVPWYDVRR